MICKYLLWNLYFSVNCSETVSNFNLSCLLGLEVNLSMEAAVSSEMMVAPPPHETVRRYILYVSDGQ